MKRSNENGESSSKKSKLEKAGSPSKDSATLLDQIKEKRLKTAKSILDFEFKKKRVRILSSSAEVKEKSDAILYWMSRDQRVQDNWAFLFAQKLALKNELPLKVAFCLVPSFLNAPLRHFDFLLNGLKEVSKECNKLDIDFHLLLGSPGTEVPKFVKEKGIGGVVCDLSPLKVPVAWVDEVKKNVSIL